MHIKLQTIARTIRRTSMVALTGYGRQHTNHLHNRHTFNYVVVPYSRQREMELISIGLIGHQTF